MGIRRKGRLALPGAFTSGNLFFGFYSIVEAIRMDLVTASWLVIAGAVLDFVDGKVARLSKGHSRFGMELDSLADVVTFGVAPSVIMFSYFLRTRGEWSWLLAFGFLFAGVLRLARYNVEDPGPGKRAFNGLPIPIAGMFLVSFLPFSTTAFYARYFGDVNNEKFLSVSIVLTSILMISNIQYPTFPALRGRGIFSIVAIVSLLLFGIAVFTVPEHLFFIFAFIYIVAGFVRSVVVGMLEKSTDRTKA